MSDVINSIEQDFRSLQKTVHYAKMGCWDGKSDSVWGILGASKKRNVKEKIAWFLNCIPENRRWGLLHQAVYWQNTTVIKYFLSLPVCDTDLLTKSSSCDRLGNTSGLTASELAVKYSYNDIESLINRSTKEKITPSTDTFKVLDENEFACELPLITYTVVSYKNTFHPKTISTNYHLCQVLREIYEYINSSKDTWKAVMAKTCDSLEHVAWRVTMNLKKSSESKKAFFSSIINAYTDENTYLYTDLNTALRRQKPRYCPDARDLALGPYILMYQLLLLFWDVLEKESNPTYRCMILCDSDVAKYKKGVKFSWECFVSSSVDKIKAIPFPTRSPVKGDHKVLFKINNNGNSTWKPRNIEKYACWMEKERVYPAGAKFVVTETHRQDKMDKEKTYIKLTLLDDDNTFPGEENMFVEDILQTVPDNLRGAQAPFHRPAVPLGRFVSFENIERPVEDEIQQLSPYETPSGLLDILL